MTIQPSTRFPTRLPLAFARSCLLAAAALAACALAAPAAGASPVTYDGIAADGSVAFFSTDEALSPGDTDHERDVYARSYDQALERFVTREVSIGPVGGNDARPVLYDDVSADGTRVFFSTKEPLVSADEDQSTDIYERDLASGTTSLASRGSGSCEPSCGNGEFDASFAPGGLTPDGEELFFVSNEQLSAADHDSSPDVYVRDLGADTTSLVDEDAAGCGAQGCGGGALAVTFNGVSTDGSLAVLSTYGSLAEEDEDEIQDLYSRDLGLEATQLVSTPGTCPGSVDCKAVFGGISANGAHVFFESSEQISAADRDESQDVYDWTPGGGAVLASVGPSGGNGAANATYAGETSDGSGVFFETSEQLVPADTDESGDIYERAGGVTTLVSTGPENGNGPFNAYLRWVSPQGSSPAVVFTTDEQLTAADEDSSQDVYERAGGVTALVSTAAAAGNGAVDAAFAGASSDGGHVFFLTTEQMAAEDQDSGSDIYDRHGGATTLVSTGAEGGNGGISSGLVGVSHDGSRAFFTTEERLTEGDPDAELDVYERSGGATRLVSAGNLLPLGPVTPTLTGTSPSSPASATTPSVLGQAEPGAWVKLYMTSDCSGEPIAQGTAEQLGAEGLAVSVAADSSTSFRATAEAGGLVSPCSAPITYRHETPQEQPQEPPSEPPPPPPGETTGKGGGGTVAGSGGGKKGTGQQETPHVGGPSPVTPETLITFGPGSKTRKRKLVFRFSDATGQEGSSFTCRIDRRRWKACGSPERLAKLGLGRHVFAVKAINKVGTADESPATKRFQVVR